MPTKKVELLRLLLKICSLRLESVNLLPQKYNRLYTTLDLTRCFLAVQSTMHSLLSVRLNTRRL
jgi:hypothetical protein